MKIRIIGYGRLAKSLVEQWINQHSIVVSAPSLPQQQLAPNLKTTPNNLEAISDSQVIILAVKPSIIEKVLIEISPHLQNNCLIISLAAAINLNILEALAPSHAFITRVMPNIAAEVNASATVALKNSKLSSKHIQLIEQLFLECGYLEWVDNDNSLDLVTIIAGSGPAYVFYFIEALQTSIINLGLSKELTHRIIYQTMDGSVKLAKNNMPYLDQKIEQVCSPKGITAEALEVFEKEQFNQIIQKALEAALNKIRRLQS